MEEKTEVTNWVRTIAGQEVRFVIAKEAENAFTSSARIIGTDYQSTRNYDHNPSRYEVEEQLERSPEFRKRAGLERIS